MKPQKYRTSKITPDEHPSSTGHAFFSLPPNLDQVGSAARQLLQDNHLEVSKVRPFFWSIVETYLDRFHVYPFDIVRALFSYLETNDYPPDVMRDLVKQLEKSYAQQYGEPMHKTTRLMSPEDTLDDEIKELRASLKYAALVDELDQDKD